MQLDAMEFMRRFLQHVLPTGFMKVRYYGFLHPSCSVSLERIAALIQLAFDFEITMPETEIEPLRPITCSVCGGSLLFLSLILPFEAPLADSG